MTNKSINEQLKGMSKNPLKSDFQRQNASICAENSSEATVFRHTLEESSRLREDLLNCYNAELICIHASNLLQKEQLINTVVHSSFENVCNLLTSQGLIIPLISQKTPMQPRGIKIINFNGFDFKQDEHVALHFKDSDRTKRLRRLVDSGDVGNCVAVSYANTKIWRGKLTPRGNNTPDQIQANINIMKAVLLKNGDLSGLGILCDDGANNIYSDFAEPRINKLLEALSLDKNIEDCASNLIGFGLGLTPSADDFLAGLMLSRFYCRPAENIAGQNKIIARLAETKTTKISAEMLSFAAIGEGSENIMALIESLLYGSVQETEKNTNWVLQNGSTSGADCIAGIYIGMRGTETDRRWQRMKGS